VCGLGYGAERACKRDRAFCGIGGTEFRAAFGNTAAGGCDSTAADGHTAGQHSHTSGRYGDTADAAAGDVSKHDAAGTRSGIEFAGHTHAGR
jgi:hypothetical protein